MLLSMLGSHDSKYYVADGKRQGCHWALLFVDLEVSIILWSFTWMVSPHKLGGSG